MTKPLKIVTIPNPVLRQLSKPVELTPPVKKLIKRMKASLVVNGQLTGLGLSAPQVGYNWRIFVTINKDNQQPLPLRVFINPTIIKKSKKKVVGIPQSQFPYEGCLSIPDIYGLVDRHQWIRIKYQTLDKGGNLVDKEEKIDGLLSIVVQHEYDHLEGILFIDRVVKAGRPLYRLETNNQGQEELVPLEKSLPVFEFSHQVG